MAFPWLRGCRKLLKVAQNGVLPFLLATTCFADPLPHSAYLWQRQWNEPVRAALTNAAPALAGVVVLAAEISRNQTVRISPDYSALRSTGKPYGIALRVGADATATPEFAAALLAGTGATELQIDYDCAESKLDSYRPWLTAIRARVAPTPVTITALPSWLRQPSFSNLVSATDGFVLQVHSFSATLCDTGLAARAVTQAALCGVPFRVALPTYGYVAAHDRNGKLIGISAEGPSRNWSPAAILSEVHADAPALATLVRGWDAQRPPSLRGILWYRLPIATDTLNWRWPTLATIIAGDIPRPFLVAKHRSPQPGLVEVDLVNTGAADAYANTAVVIRWHDATLLACDGLAGYAISTRETNTLTFTGNPRLGPGERRMVGWLRFHESREVACDIQVE